MSHPPRRDPRPPGRSAATAGSAASAANSGPAAAAEVLHSRRQEYALVRHRPRPFGCPMCRRADASRMSDIGQVALGRLGVSLGTAARQPRAGSKMPTDASGAGCDHNADAQSGHDAQERARDTSRTTAPPQAGVWRPERGGDPPAAIIISPLTAGQTQRRAGRACPASPSRRRPVRAFPSLRTIAPPARPPRTAGACLAGIFSSRAFMPSYPGTIRGSALAYFCWPAPPRRAGSS